MAPIAPPPKKKRKYLMFQSSLLTKSLSFNVNPWQDRKSLADLGITPREMFPFLDLYITENVL